MTPIINPMWFYWLEVFNSLGELLFWIGVCGFILAFAIVMFVSMVEEELPKGTIKRSMPFLISFFILIVVSIFMPSQETMYKMMLANYATTDNITEITTSIQNGVDYIFDKIEDVSEEKE